MTLRVQRDRLVVQAAAVDEEGVAALAQAGNELVHDPDPHPQELVLRPLAEKGRLRPVQLPAA